MAKPVVSDELVREISEQIITEQFLENWSFYLLFLAITLLVNVVSSYLIARFRKSGELAAITANLDTVNDQLDTQTRIVKKIDTEISFADWKAREWNALRRSKLEELLNEAATGKDWVALLAQRSLYNVITFRHKSSIALRLGDATSLTNVEKFELEPPVNIERVGNLTHLYFRELIHEWEEYEFTCLEFFVESQKIYQELIGIPLDETERYNSALSEANRKVQERTNKVILVTKTLRNKAASLVTKIMDGQNTADDA